MFHSPIDAAPQFLKKIETCSMNPHLAKAKLIARIFFSRFWVHHADCEKSRIPPLLVTILPQT